MPILKLNLLHARVQKKRSVCWRHEIGDGIFDEGSTESCSKADSIDVIELEEEQTMLLFCLCFQSEMVA